MNFILFITAWLLFLPLTIWNYFLVKTDGYFLSSALNLDIYANREFRTLWNKYLRIEDGYHFGYNEETISSAIGHNKKANTLTKTGLFLYKFLNMLEKNHCEIAAGIIKKR